MKNLRHAAIAALLITLIFVRESSADPLRISSQGFQADTAIPPSATCDGAGRNPELEFSGVPAAAKSLALIVFDPDVPRAIKSDGRYMHWALWDLPPDTARIAEGERARGVNENGAGGYIPACPPNGEHRYVFQLFALDATLGATGISSESELRRAMEGHILDRAELVGRYTTRASRVARVALGLIAVVIVIAVVYRIIVRRRRSLASDL